MKKLIKKQRTESSKIDKCCKNCHYFEHGVCTNEDFMQITWENPIEDIDDVLWANITPMHPNDDYCSRWR